jgi:hypothetical protein
MKERDSAVGISSFPHFSNSLFSGICMLIQVEKNAITEFSGTVPVCQVMHVAKFTNSYFSFFGLKNDRTDWPLL